MMNSSLPPEIRDLPVSDRLELAEQIWDSIIEDEQQFRLTDDQKAGARREIGRLRELTRPGAPWETVKARLLGNG